MSKQSDKNKIEYAQNLSHELMTPLAVIRSKVELLLQSPHLSEDDMNNLDIILKTVERMNRLNKALIILSKLDNNVYVDSEKVDLNDMVSSALEKFQDQIRLKELSIRFSRGEDIVFETNKNILDILLTNLIKNAVLHNYPHGRILIETNTRYIKVENTCNKDVPENIFNRFVSSVDKPHSLGLGLAIVSKICESFNYELSHNISAESFTIEVKF
ncbi:MAG: HAMP domain-containing histidine kinase [Crocinitomicaceae bacterium]|nr:HAMP domain-containing histidine kinase [Crocinitomicaceae bacterium]